MQFIEWIRNNNGESVKIMSRWVKVTKFGYIWFIKKIEKANFNREKFNEEGCSYFALN